MSEFEYPMWFKSIDSDMVVRFDDETSGEVVKESIIEDCNDYIYKYSEYSDCWATHTNDSEWLDVTDQYKDKAEIPPLSICGGVSVEEAVKSLDFRDSVIDILDNIENMLIEKNKSYGNAALNPLRVFSKASPIEQLKVRIDDKLSRIEKGNEFIGDDTINDLIGYLVLYKIATKDK